MLTLFSILIIPHHVKPDKSVRIKIKITHKGQRRYVDSGIVASKEDYSAKSFKLKNTAFIDELNAIIKGYRDKCNKAPQRIAQMDPDQLVSFLTDPHSISPDFIAFAKDHISLLKAKGKDGTVRNRQTAVNALIRFRGEVLPVNRITPTFLEEFKAFIEDNPLVEGRKMVRAAALYLTQIRAIHNDMKRRLNNEEQGVIKVPFSPFAAFRIPKDKPTRKRSLTVSQIQQLFALEHEEGQTRYNLALDCFKLSFCLIGMNSVDLYTCPAPHSGVLTYNRQKTSGRRDDKAEIQVNIPAEISEIVKRYRDKPGKRAFCFHRLYSSAENFNQAINKGLKEVGRRIGEEGLTYYAARHSWATIALNRCGIDKYTVHAALNHVDEAMRVTDIYIEKDFTAINEANHRVLEYIDKYQRNSA